MKGRRGAIAALLALPAAFAIVAAAYAAPNRGPPRPRRAVRSDGAASGAARSASWRR